MKKLVSMVALAAFAVALNVNAQEPKQEKKTAKTEKSCCADKKSCSSDKKEASTDKKAGCCAAKKAESK
jgi:Ni/Co efflux regulator RcnB